MSNPAEEPVKEYSDDNIIEPEIRWPLSEFLEHSAEAFDRLNRTGEAELITVKDRACAVLLSPRAYDKLLSMAFLSYDVETIERSRKEIAEGNFMQAGEFFDQLHAKLLDLKAKSADQ